MANFPELVPHLSDLRKAAGLTRPALAEKTGVSLSFISKCENGTLCPYEDNAVALADALGVTVDELIGKYNARIWKTVLPNCKKMDDIYGTRSLKRFVDFMRPIVEPQA